MEKLIIVDTGCQSVEIHIYDIDSDTVVNEDYIKSLGHEDYGFYYFATDVKVINHGNKATN